MRNNRFNQGLIRVKSFIPVFVLALIGSASYAQTCTLSVSKSPFAGDTATKNFQVLQDAADYLAKPANATALRVGKTPVTVCVYSGTYWASDAVVANDAPSPLLTNSKDVNHYDPNTYTGGTVGDALKIYSLRGTAKNPVTFTAAPGNSPVIMQTGYNAIDVAYDTSYIVINGFTVYGITNDFTNNVNYTSAVTNRYSDANGTPGFWPYYDGNCISVIGDAPGYTYAHQSGVAKSTEGANTILKPTIAQLRQIPSHITIQNNKVYGCGGGGITAQQSDYIKILNNVISGCSHYSIYGTSGISLFDSLNVDSDVNTNPGVYKNFITGNHSWGNQELVPWVYVGYISDGEGIIIDTNQNTSDFGVCGSCSTYVRLPGYKGGTLVGDNVITGNGGPAIEVLASYNVDVIDNSTYGNVLSYKDFPAGTDGVQRAEFQVSYSAFVNATDNIFSATQPPSNKSPNTNPSAPYGGGQTPHVPYAQGSIFLENNSFYANGASFTAPLTADSYGVTDVHNYYSSDPWYVSPASSTWDTQANLQVYVGSPALSSGAGDSFDTVYLPTDINGHSFKQANGVYAIGAYAVGVQGN